jgi:hypothetical protein
LSGAGNCAPLQLAAHEKRIDKLHDLAAFLGGKARI